MSEEKFNKIDFSQLLQRASQNMVSDLFVQAQRKVIEYQAQSSENFSIEAGAFHVLVKSLDDTIGKINRNLFLGWLTGRLVANRKNIAANEQMGICLFAHPIDLSNSDEKADWFWTGDWEYILDELRRQMKEMR